jgi:2-haloacid dehalogenase
LASERHAKVIAFDVNETLLDLSPLDPLLGGAEARVRWFSQMLQLSFVGGLTGRYVDFSTAQRAALEMLGHEDQDAVLDQMRRLPAHPDAAPALDRLREAGLTLAALTNSPLDVAREQLEHAGLADRFHAILSADQVQALKPRPEPYHLVARTFEVEPATSGSSPPTPGTSPAHWQPAAPPPSCAGRGRCRARSATSPTSSATTSTRSPPASSASQESSDSLAFWETHLPKAFFLLPFVP